MTRGILAIRTCVLMCIGCGVSAVPPVTEPAHRAVKRISAATAIGVNKAAYGELLQDAAAELLILQDLAEGTADTIPLRLYLQALDKYKDANSLWAE